MHQLWWLNNPQKISHKLNQVNKSSCLATLEGKKMTFSHRGFMNSEWTSHLQYLYHIYNIYIVSSVLSTHGFDPGGTVLCWCLYFFLYWTLPVFIISRLFYYSFFSKNNCLFKHGLNINTKKFVQIIITHVDSSVIK